MARFFLLRGKTEADQKLRICGVIKWVRAPMRPEFLRDLGNIDRTIVRCSQMDWLPDSNGDQS